MKFFKAAGAFGAATLLPAPLAAQEFALKPIADARLRYESVAQDNALEHAEALTVRVRAGGEAKAGDFSVLAEGEATLALADEYNPFPFPEATAQRRPNVSAVPDPRNLELNRLQIGWASDGVGVTLGRQRINLGDQRWVGSVGWRQNEQTFDAIRATATTGPLLLDGAYAVSQRTIFGRDAGPRQGYDGRFVFANAGFKLSGVTLTGFAYLVGYDEHEPVAALSSQTYGVVAQGVLDVGPAKLAAKASYARQSDWRNSPAHYAADYFLAEASAGLVGFQFTGGWERLGSDNGSAVQTPLATLHKFNGFADLFLTTPPAGLDDAYVGLTRELPFPGQVTAGVTFHQFDSAVGSLEYGREWDLTLGARLGKVALLAKYADYQAAGFGVDTRKLWLQAELAF